MIQRRLGGSVLSRYILFRTLLFIATIFMGITITFFIMKAMPVNAVESMLQSVLSQGQVLDPENLNALRQTFYEIFGLRQGPLESYLIFIRRAFTFNFGPSIISYPTPAAELVLRRLPWTIGLLSMSTIISWIVGNTLGALAGYFAEKRLAKILESVAVILRPIPYYIMALVLIAVFAYMLPIFPQGGGLSVISEQLTWEVVANIIWHSFLPALSLVIPGVLGWAFLSSRVLSMHVKAEDYVRFAEVRGVPNRRILNRYILRNIMPTQITNLALDVGLIFNGALLTEVVFAYPGVGNILYRAVFSGDINTLMAVVFLSILAVSTAIFFIDLLYPLLDPRIRYR